MLLLLPSIKRYATVVAIHQAIHQALFMCCIVVSAYALLCALKCGCAIVGHVPDLSGMATRSDDSSKRGPAMSKANKIGSSEKEAQKRENDWIEKNQKRVAKAELRIRILEREEEQQMFTNRRLELLAKCREDMRDGQEQPLLGKCREDMRGGQQEPDAEPEPVCEIGACRVS